MLEAEYEKEREKIEGKEDDMSEEELIQASRQSLLLCRDRLTTRDINGMRSYSAPFYRKINEKLKRKGEENVYTGKRFKVKQRILYTAEISSL